MTFRFLHAADLHLDCPFEGLSAALETHPAAARRVGAATLGAFDALLDLALARKVDCVLLSGDVYNGASRSLRALFRVHAGLSRLAGQGIHSFICHGNHDPLDGSVPRLDWPEGVHVFAAERVETVTLQRDGVDLARISGISYGRSREERNLASWFPPALPGLFSIAMLHCSVGDQPGHAPYAPCSLTDLRGAGYDYWALGHVHAPAVLSHDPLVVYPGALQGLSIRESGPHGCVLVDVNQGQVRSECVPLAPVQWEVVSISLTGLQSLTDLEEAVLEAIETACGALQGAGMLVVRINLQGSGPLAEILGDGAAQDELLEHLREQVAGCSSPLVWIKDLCLQTRLDPGDREVRLRRGDFLGEVFRAAAELRADPDRLQAALRPVLAELYGSRSGRRASLALADAELAQILEAAEALCANLLDHTPE